MVLYKAWSHQRPLKLPQETWEFAYYKWKPPLHIVQMLDREQNYHDCKLFGQQSHDAKKHKGDLMEDIDLADSTATYSTTTPSTDVGDPTLPQPSFNASASIRAYFDLVKANTPTNTPKTDLNLSCADDLSPEINTTLAANDVDLSKWIYDVKSVVPARPSVIGPENTVTAASVLLETAFADAIPPQAALTVYMKHYAERSVPLLSLSMDTIAAVHNLNQKQRIVFEIGAASLLRAHIWGLDVTQIPVDETTSDIERRRVNRLNNILNHEQQILLFQSGCAGTGKSVTIHAISHFAQSWGMVNRLAVTAPTGSAALVINGCTLHSFSKLNKFLKPTSSKTEPQSPHLTLLIIDEISFVSCDFLQSVHLQLQRRNQSALPFGGISVIFSGDMAQLPPVGTGGKVPLYHVFSLNKTEETHMGNEKNAAFCGSKLWQSVTNVVVLTHNYRAEEDPLFIDFLNHVRIGRQVTQQHVDALLKRRISPELLLIDQPPIGTSMVWRENKDVNAANSLLLHRNARCHNRTVYRFPAVIKENEASGGSGNVLPHTSNIHHASYLVGILRSDNAKTLPIAMLDLYLGALVTIYKDNKLMEFGVANGSEGCFVGTYPNLDQLPKTIIDVRLPDNSTSSVVLVEEMPLFFLFHIPNSNFRFPNLPENVLPLAPCKHTKVTVYSTLSPYTYQVSQVQIRLFGATTVHTSQGKTNAPNFVGNLRKDQGFNYVALSRGKSFSNTYIGSHVKLKITSFNNPIPHSLEIQLSKETLYSDKFVHDYLQRTTASPQGRNAVEEPLQSQHEGTIRDTRSSPDVNHILCPTHTNQTVHREITQESCSLSEEDTTGSPRKIARIAGDDQPQEQLHEIIQAPNLTPNNTSIPRLTGDYFNDFRSLSAESISRVLDSSRYIDDAVVNAMLALITRRLQAASTSYVPLSSHVICAGDPAKWLRKTLHKTRPTSTVYDVTFVVPINIQSYHWCLATIQLSNRNDSPSHVYIYDSLQYAGGTEVTTRTLTPTYPSTDRTQTIDLLFELLYKLKCSTYIHSFPEMSSIVSFSFKPCFPQTQLDCGALTIITADFIVNGVNPLLFNNWSGLSSPPTTQNIGALWRKSFVYQHTLFMSL